MAETELTLIGEKYTGAFTGKRVAREISYGSSCSEHTIDGRFYEGTGLIRELDSSKVYFFTFSTEPYDRGDPCRPMDLEESLVDIAVDITIADKRRIRLNSYKKIVDLALKNIIEKAGSSQSSIPKVEIVGLNYRLLVERGYLPAGNGQLNLLDLLK